MLILFMVLYNFGGMMRNFNRESEWNEALPLSCDNRSSHKYSKDIESIINEIGATRVLDYGCGEGRLCTSFSKDNYLGVDIDEKLIAHANSTFAQYNFQEVQEVIYTADICILSEVLGFIEDNQIHTILKAVRSKWILLVDNFSNKDDASTIISLSNRKKDDYIKMMRNHDLLLFKHMNKALESNSVSNASFLLFRRCGRNPNL